MVKKTQAKKLGKVTLHYYFDHILGDCDCNASRPHNPPIKPHLKSNIRITKTQPYIKIIIFLFILGNFKYFGALLQLPRFHGPLFFPPTPACN